MLLQTSCGERPDPTETSRHGEYDGSVERVVVLALDGVYPFELGIPNRVFGSAEGRYEILTCTVDGRPVRSSADFSITVEHGPEVLTHGRHGRHPAVRAVADQRRSPRGGDRRAEGHPAGRPDRLHLHGRLRPGGGGDARRTPGDDALAAGPAVPEDVPGRGPGRRRAVRRRGLTPHLGGSRVRRGRLPAPRAQGPRQRAGQPRGPVLRGAAVAGRRSGPVHRAARARTLDRGHRGHPAVGPGTPRRTADPGRSRRPRPDEPADVRPPVQRRGRDQPRPLADPATRRPRTAAARSQRSVRWTRSPARSASPPAPRSGSICTRRSASRRRPTGVRSRRPGRAEGRRTPTERPEALVRRRRDTAARRQGALCGGSRRADWRWRESRRSRHS